MKHFDLLENRHHVREYSLIIPKKELIENSLWKAWKTTPSKNNAMPYKVFVYGPKHKEEKIDISYTSCFRREQKYWQEVGLKHAEYRPIILMTAGYSVQYRKDVPYVKRKLKQDIKPEYEEMIQWM